MKRQLLKAFRKKLMKHWTAFDKRMSWYELDNQHIKNTKLLPNRNRLLELLPKNGIVAELGVNKGEFSEEILKRNEPKKLHLVDVWSSERYHQGLKLEVEDKFQSQIEAGQVEINLGLSTQVVDQFEDNYFDWVYIDTDHSYKTTIDELNMYAPKVKEGGFLTGHDFIIGSWNNMVKYGVIQAVYEFCSLQNWEIIYITMENKGAQSFAIRKIANTNAAENS